jgi:hypothetical protein
VGPGRAAELVAPDRDRLLAALHEATFSTRVESTIECRACREPFELAFVLADLLASLREVAPLVIERDPGAVYRLPDGRCFRLPTGIDERALIGLEPADAERELLRRCVVAGSSAEDPAPILDGMEAVGPLADADLDARCPSCGEAQPVHFDLQHYLLSRFEQERRQRVAEVHRLAHAYGWTLGEILSLSRPWRRALVEQIERDTPWR